MRESRDYRQMASDAWKRWEVLRADVVARIDEIDKDTPWQETEPTWWLKMMEIRRLLVRPGVTGIEKGSGEGG